MKWLDSLFGPGGSSNSPPALGPSNFGSNPSDDSIPSVELQLRRDLAACYRLVALQGWTDLVFTHISVRIPGDEPRFLINPYGMLFEEITASSLIMIDLEGNKLSESSHPVNPAGFTIHSAIHAARNDITCILHTHTRAGAAVSAQRTALLPISQQATWVLGSLGIHDYEGTAVREDEKLRFQRDLGENDFLLMRNHGLLTVGRSVAEAFLFMYIFETACQIQLAAQSGGTDLVEVDPTILSKVAEQSRTRTTGLHGELVWPALLRKLDRLCPEYVN